MHKSIEIKHTLTKTKTFSYYINMPDNIDNLLDQILRFSRDREWEKFHTSKNLILALTSELGELSEHFQWRNDAEILEFLSNPENKARVEEEVADVAIYLIRLAQVMNIDLINAIRNKIEVNSLKYPIETSKGNATKYSEREKH